MVRECPLHEVFPQEVPLRGQRAAARTEERRSCDPLPERVLRGNEAIEQEEVHVRREHHANSRSRKTHPKFYLDRNHVWIQKRIDEMQLVKEHRSPTLCCYEDTVCFYLLVKHTRFFLFSS